jgi:phosphoribosylformylglycinamidine (FGAM) synthase PurS component
MDAMYPPEATLRTIETSSVLDAHIWGPRAPIAISISPSGKSDWTLLEIVILLNELDETWHRGARSRLVFGHSPITKTDRYLRFLFECNDTLLEQSLEIKVFVPTWEVEVKAAREWVQIEWRETETIKHSTEASQFRTVQAARPGKYTQLTLEVTVKKDATRSIIEKCHFF